MPSRSAIITGSAQGIGKAIAFRLLHDEYNIVVNDLPENEQLVSQVVREFDAANKGEGKVIGVAVNAAQEDGVKLLIERCVESFGSLDVMVCNVGTILVKPIIETSVEEMDRLFTINFRSMWLGYSLAATQMIKQGKGGRIIGASSTSGKKGIPTLAAYSSTKFAIRGLTQSAAQEWGRHGITVNAYCPGVTDTPLCKSVSSELSALFGGPGLELSDVCAKAFPVGRMGIPDDIAGVVSFLASESSAFVTGQSFTVDGGTIFD